MRVKTRAVWFSCLILTSLCLAGCFKSKNEVLRVPSRAEIAEGRKPLKKLDGVPYRLPRTVVQVSLPVKKVEKEPGPFMKFAPCFFTSNDLGDLVTEESTQFSLQKPGFSTLGEPDPDESYVVKIKGGYFENKSLLMEYTPTGILSKGEAESKDESLEFTLKAIKTATSIAGAISGIRVGNVDAVSAIESGQRDEQRGRTKRCYGTITSFSLQRLKKLHEAKEKSWTVFNNADANHKADAKAAYEVALKRYTDAQVSYEAARVEESAVLKEQASSQRLFDDYEQAEKAFERVTVMQANRETLVSQPANVNQETFNRLLEETDKTIDAYRALFLGLQAEKVWKGVFTYRPNKSDSQLSLPFFAYSATEGLCEIGLSVNQGQRVPPAFKSDKCDNLASFKGIWLLVQKDRDDDEFRRRIATANSESQNSEGTRGWYYRIPAKAVAYLMTAKMSELSTNPARVTADELESARLTDPRDIQFTEIARTDISVAQLGIVASIPASAAGRTNQANITLDETTGALRNFKYTSSSLLEKSVLEEAEGAAKDVIDAKDPLKKKKRELDMLKTEKDIRDAKKALENSNSSPPQ